MCSVCISSKSGELVVNQAYADHWHAVGHLAVMDWNVRLFVALTGRFSVTNAELERLGRQHEAATVCASTFKSLHGE